MKVLTSRLKDYNDYYKAEEFAWEYADPLF
jgi:hypothetical protein